MKHSSLLDFAPIFNRRFFFSGRVLPATALSKPKLGIVLWLCLAVNFSVFAQSKVLLPWINYSPYTQPGQNPNAGTIISESQIITHLDTLKFYAEGIRTFGTQNGLEHIPRLAKERGLKVIVGIWLSASKAANAAQIDNGIAIVKAGHADRIIVGSEVLLRGDLHPDTLLKHINQVKAVCQPLGIPVSCADEYHFLLCNPKIMAACDFIAPNIYPFWEAAPIEKALCWFDKAYHAISAKTNGKPIFISESGWKTSGNGNGQAQPSLPNAIRYLVGLRHWSKAKNVEVNIFSAFDEPWKGTFDDGWGIFTNNLKLKTGMDTLFSPIANVDTTWLCPPTIIDGDPKITFTSQPVIGSNAWLEGQVDNLAQPALFKVLLFIKVGSGWWSKPTFAQPFAFINAENKWSSAYATGGNDINATEICAFLVPIEYAPPLSSGQTKIPPAVFQNAIASNCFQRYLLPSAAVVASKPSICKGDSTALHASGGSHFEWENGDTTASVKVAPMSDKTYRVTITDGKGGGSVATVSVQVLPSPNLALSVSKTLICAGQNSVLTASGGGTYLWSTGATTASIQVFPTATSTYFVTVTHATSGCSKIGSAEVRVSVPATAEMASQISNFCSSAETSLEVNFTGSAPFTLVWSENGIAQAPVETYDHPFLIPVKISKSTVYQLLSVVSAGCTGQVSGQAQMFVHPPPTLLASSGHDTIFVEISGGTPPFQFSLDGGLFQSENFFPDQSNGLHQIEVVDAFGCSDTLIFNLQHSATSQVFLNVELKILPNPSSGRFQILTKNLPSGECQFEVFDVHGKRVAMLPLNSAGGGTESFSLDLAVQPSGIYFGCLRFFDGSHTMPFRLLISR